MHKPRFLDCVAAELGDEYSFRARRVNGLLPFQPAHVEPRWPRDRTVDVRHIRLEVALDFAERTVSGTVTHRIAPIVEGLDRVEFDQQELTVRAVRVGGEAVAAEAADGKLGVPLPSAPAVGVEIEVAIDYWARPRRGLYFVGPDHAYPAKPVQAWTQGEDEDSRFWFPCYDYPNDRVTSEVAATVPENFFALSNGALVSTTHDPQRHTRTYHWRHDVPHSAYLITLAAGEFVQIEDRHGELPVQYYVAPGREEDARRAFGNTPRMIAFFERKIGLPYPYAKYAQVAVADFIFGGMENTSATTQTADTLHDARAHLDFTSDPLVAHELAHQWWGDLLTCRDWAHAWLNEGFASYFEALWCEENLGADEFAWNLRQDRENYVDEATRHYRRPVVCNRYRAPIELFDRHLYEKGSLVLHMLRRLLGDELFFKSLSLYCLRNRGRNVITQDLQHALEEATGRNLDYFFDQWIYKQGHPELEVSSSFDNQHQTLSVTVKQTHPVSESTPLFRFPVTIALMDAAGREGRHRVELNAREQVFNFVCEQAPKAVRFDPEFEILKTCKHKRGREALEMELRHAPEAIGRAAAARELGEEGSPAAVAALRRALLEDRFWGVQADAAGALGTIRTVAALSALLEATGLPHPKARRGVVRALGAFRDRPEAATALIEILARGDESYFVEAEAALSLGKTRDSRAFDHLKNALAKDSYLDVIRAHALSGMAELRDERGLGVAMAESAYGRPARARVAAIGTLGRLGALNESRRPVLLDFLSPLVDDREFMVRMRLPGALEDLREAGAIGVLRRLSDHELDGRIRRRAEQAMAALREGRSRSEESRLMRDEMDKLREEGKRLQERLDKLEAQAKTPARRRKAPAHR